jgi:hypothetical protein
MLAASCVTSKVFGVTAARTLEKDTTKIKPKARWIGSMNL